MVVAGGGGTGLMAAYAAAERGAEVLLIEKMPGRPWVGRRGWLLVQYLRRVRNYSKLQAFRTTLRRTSETTWSSGHPGRDRKTTT